VLAASPPASPAEALALTLHAALLECGFACEGAAPGAPHAPPPGWRAASGAHFSFSYSFAAPPPPRGLTPARAWLRCAVLNAELVSYGALLSDGSGGASAPQAPDVHRLALPLVAGAPAALAAPRALWAAAKDALAARLHAAACGATGAPQPPALLSLPDALKRLLLAFLPPHALAAVMCACRELRYAASDDDLWQRLYAVEFSAAAAAADGATAAGAAAGAAALAARRGARAAFAAAAAERARARRREAMAAEMRRRRPRPHIFPIPGGPLPPPPGFPGYPGIIGGDYDRIPGGGMGGGMMGGGRGGFGGGGFGGGGFGFGGGAGFGLGGGGMLQLPGGGRGRGAMGALPRDHHPSSLMDGRSAFGDDEEPY
jgi:hypothetical protein